MATTYIATLLLLIFIAGCDSQGTSTPDLVSYFPHGIGQTWNYTYEKTYLGWQAVDPANTSTIGNLRWTIVGLDENDEYAEIAINEEFEGTRRSWSDAFNYDTTIVMAWDKTLIGRLVGDKLAIEGYTDGTYRGLDSLKWLYPAETSDIVSADSSTGLGFGMFLSQGYTLEKGIGLTRFRHSEYGRWTDAIELTMIR